jgi:hypothetical protein
MGSVLVSSAVDRGFESRSGQTKDYTIGICYLSSKHAAFIHFTFIFVSAKDRVGFCSILQLCHDENKLTFNEMIMRSALY